MCSLEQVYIYIYIYANFIKHNRHFMPTYFLLDPFEFPYYFYCIRGELIHKNILPTDPNKKIELIIYHNKFKTSNLVIRNNSSPSIGVID